MKTHNVLLLSLTILYLNGCASFRSDVNNATEFNQIIQQKNRVSVTFDFYHYYQSKGFDAIPKLMNYPGISSFNDIFKESLKNISNISEFETFVNKSNDVESQTRRRERDSLINRTDYVIRIEIYREKSFAKHFLAGLLSSATLTVFPTSYNWNYTVNVTVLDKKNLVVGKYSRNADVTTWYQTFLVLIYPFYVEEKQNEDIYIEMLSNIFNQIEFENVLMQRVE